MFSISRRAGHLVVGVGGGCRAMEVRREEKGKGGTVRKRKKSKSTEEDLVSICVWNATHCYKWEES